MDDIGIEHAAGRHRSYAADRTRPRRSWRFEPLNSRERSFRNWIHVGLTPAVICLLVRSKHEQSEVR
jgi:hypothetical protein